MYDLISRKALCEYALNQKDKSITPNDIMRFPPAQPETIRPAWKADDRYVKTMFQPFPYCPKCNHYLITGDNYCSVCGRRIDWSKEDE